MNQNDMYRMVRYQDACEYCKKQSMLELTVSNDKWKHYEYAAQAIDKQIPKKVIHKGYFYGYTHRCPSCGNQVEKGAYGLNDKYCKTCGQALDWGEEE